MLQLKTITILHYNWTQGGLFQRSELQKLENTYVCKNRHSIYLILRPNLRAWSDVSVGGTGKKQRWYVYRGVEEAAATHVVS